jgi:N,N'-diacetyllegionaminate synthase
MKNRVQKVDLDGKLVGDAEPCYVISEIGGMYEDSEGMLSLIKASKDAGVNAVKIQTYRASTMALEGAEFEFEDGSRMSQYDFFKKYEISEDMHKKMYEYAKEIGITIFSTPSHYEDVDFLESLGTSVYKLGSDDLTNYPFLEYVASKGKPIILSTGMATLSEIESAVNTVTGTGNDKLILLHCTVSYPVEPKYANLKIIETLKKAFGYPVGYSDHVFGVLPSVLAAQMGACIVEKHVTLDRSKKLPDYQVSLEPAELKELVSHIRMIPILEGSSVKKVYLQEEKWRKNARKSLVAARDINAGTKLTKDDVKIMRPGTGIHPKYREIYLSRTVNISIKENDIIPIDAF